MPPANRSSWTIQPAPVKREPLGFEATFSREAVEQFNAGHIPKDMGDKWFIFHEQRWLYFHRSWTGALIYWVRLEETTDGMRVVESWVNRDPKQYKGRDTAYDRELVRFLIDAFLLNKNVVFLLPRGAEHHAQGGVQHNLVGRAYPERPLESVSNGDR